MDDGAQVGYDHASNPGLDHPFDYMNHPSPPEAPITYGRYQPPAAKAPEAYVLDVHVLIDADKRVAIGTDLNELRTAFANKYGDKPKSPYAFYEWTSPIFQLPGMVTKTPAIGVAAE